MLGFSISTLLRALEVFCDAAGIPKEAVYDNTNRMKGIRGETTQLEVCRKEEIRGYFEYHKNAVMYELWVMFVIILHLTI